MYGGFVIQYILLLKVYSTNWSCPGESIGRTVMWYILQSVRALITLLWLPSCLLLTRPCSFPWTRLSDQSDKGTSILYKFTSFNSHPIFSLNSSTCSARLGHQACYIFFFGNMTWRKKRWNENTIYRSLLLITLRYSSTNCNPGMREREKETW